MNDSSAVFALGFSPEQIEQSRRAWLRFVHILALGAGGLAVLVVFRIEKLTPEELWTLMGVAALLVAVILIAGRRCIMSKTFGQGRMLEAELTRDAVVFRRRNGSEERIPYANFLGAAAVYGYDANGHAAHDYDRLHLLFLTGDNAYRITDLDSPGEVVEDLAEAICEQVKITHGVCAGGREFGRELRRAQKKKTYSLPKRAFIVLVGIVMMFVLAMAERGAWRENAILSNGAAATGVVSEIIHEKGKCLVKYTFRDRTEMAYSGSGALKKSDGLKLMKFGAIDVLYLPDAPERNLPRDFLPEAPLPARILCWLFIGCFLAAAALISSGRDLVFRRGKFGVVRMGELEEEWWERTHGQRTSA